MRIEYNAGQLRKTGSHHRVNPGGRRGPRNARIRVISEDAATSRHKKAPGDAGAFELLS